MTTVDSKTYAIQVLNDGDARLPVFDREAFSHSEDTARIEKAKKNLETIAKIGGETLVDIANLARQEASAKGYDVMAKMINSLVEVNRSIIEAEKNLPPKDGSKGDSHQHVHFHGEKKPEEFEMSVAELTEKLKAR